MTRKDYIALARDLQIDYNQCDTDIEFMLFDSILDSICVALKKDNGAFDRAKFVAAVKA